MKPQDEPATDSMFEAALVALDVPIIIHEYDEILFANAAACRALRAADTCELVGASITSFVHRDGREAGQQRRELVLEHGQVIRDLPVKLKGVDGSTLYARVSGKRIEWGNRTAILLCASSVVASE